MRSAHVDEAAARLPDGRRLYVVAAVLSNSEDHEAITATLTALRDKDPLHFRNESQERRLVIAEVIAGVPLHGAVMATISTTDSGQEKARARLLCELLPRLQHVEQVGHVVLESRAGGDRFDRRTLNRLRMARRVGTELRMDHAGKEVAMLWTADFVASSYVAATRHSEPKPWEILNAAHPIEITELSPG